MRTSSSQSFSEASRCQTKQEVGVPDLSFRSVSAARQPLLPLSFALSPAPSLFWPTGTSWWIETNNPPYTREHSKMECASLASKSDNFFGPRKAIPFLFLATKKCLFALFIAACRHCNASFFGSATCGPDALGRQR